MTTGTQPPDTTAMPGGAAAEPATWRALLRRPDFRRIWIAHGLSSFGSHLTGLALPLLILYESGSATLAGLVATVKMLAHTAANLPGGALADRLPRRSVLIIADASRAAFMLAIGIIVAIGAPGGLPALLVLTAAESVVSAAADPAGTAATRHLVATHQIPAALAFGMARANAVGLTAPLVGGVLFAVEPVLPFLLDAGSYLLSMAMVARVHRDLGGGGGQRRSLGFDIREGLRYLMRSRFLVMFVVWAALLNVGTAGITFGLVVLFGPDGATRLGIIAVAVSLAGIAGAAMATRFSTALNVGWTMWGSSALIVAAAAAVAARPGPVLLVACVVVFALLGPVLAVPLNARLFTVVPDELMGRVQGSMLLVASSLYPFATVGSGALAEHYSLGTAFTVCTVLLIGALGVSVLPDLRRAGRQD